MKQYNRIMPGAHGTYIDDCLKNSYIGIGFLEDSDLSSTPYDNEESWRKQLIETYLHSNPEKTIGTARNSVGFLWTVCFGLKIGDVVLASNGKGGYHVGEITSNYFYCQSSELPHRRAMKWYDVVIQRSSMSKELKNSTGSIGTCCNITKYSTEIDGLVDVRGSDSMLIVRSPAKTDKYKERNLHKLLANYLLNNDIFSKTIFHETSSPKSDSAQKWVHPDMIGVKFNEFQETATQSLLKAAETKEYIDLYSYELKRSIDNDHQLKEYFFQALSNSNWANYGYLVALEINEVIMEEMERLNRSFGIGVICLSPMPDDTKIIFPARENNLDYYTIDKLCRMNKDFEDFINKTTKVVNAQNDIIEEVKDGLRKFCDEGFANDDEIKTYCENNKIPM